jgi:gamma-glutamylcysteine synthetase
LAGENQTHTGTKKEEHRESTRRLLPKKNTSPEAAGSYGENLAERRVSPEHGGENCRRKQNDSAEMFELIRPMDRRTRAETAAAVKFAGHSEGRQLNGEYEHRAE